MVPERLSRWLARSRTPLLALALALAIAAAVPATGSASLASLTGAGLLTSLACVACVGVIVFVGGGTPLGVLAVAGASPEAVAACLAICVVAAT